MNDARSAKDNGSRSVLEDVKVNTRVLLAGFWISQFLLWTFGDMVGLLQELNNPASNNLLAFVAAPLALTQAAMIILCLAAPAKIVRWANLVVVPVFILFNIGYLTEGKFGWQFLLGTGYIMVNVLMIVYAWKWPRSRSEKSGEVS